MEIDLIPEQSLADTIADACAEIEEAAESARQTHYTPGSTKAAEYARKSQEAEEYLRTGNAEGLPYVQAEAAREGISERDAAEFLRRRARECAHHGAMIDDAVKAGKAACRRAASHAEAGRARVAALTAVEVLGANW